ncbi:MAG: hypothetical protein FWH36_05485 [Lentimicrobiaceae bacterium]|nr:hypothetical protein [Lentimicrobiaceae bacterium]
MNVIVLPEVFDYLDKLVIILYEKEYFGFMETSRNYVKELLEDIKANLPTKLQKTAPKHFDKYGKNMEYASFRKNKNTVWYVFFTTYLQNGKTIYLVRYIANNHTVAQYL